jgi:hypothetical protein
VRSTAGSSEISDGVGRGVSGEISEECGFHLPCVFLRRFARGGRTTGSDAMGSLAGSSDRLP